MASTTTTKACLVLSLALVGVLLLSAVAQGEPDACKVDNGALARECGPYVSVGGSKRKPSAGCCAVVKKTDIGCACRTLMPKLPKSMSRDKICYVASYCKNPLKPGSKCGDYKVPAKC